MKRPSGAQPSRRQPAPGADSSARSDDRTAADAPQRSLIRPGTAAPADASTTGAPHRSLIRPGTSVPADEAQTVDLSDVRQPSRTPAPGATDDDATQDLSGLRPPSATPAGDETEDLSELRAGLSEPSRRSAGGSFWSSLFRRRPTSSATTRDDAEIEAEDALASALAAAETAAADRAAWIDDIAPASAASDLRKARKSRRRTERAEMRRFTETGRRRRRNWLIGGAIVAGLALVAAALAFTPIMSVRTIEVVGADRVNGEDLAHALSGQQGQPFPFVDDTAIRDVLSTYPLIESYSVESRPPSTLLVTIVERTPLGVVKNGDAFDLVDAAGVVIETTKTAPEGYPIIDIRQAENPKAFAAAGAVLRSVPSTLLPRITSVTATTRDNVTFTLSGTKATVLWGDAAEGTLKAALLEALITAKPDAQRYDVTSTEIGVVG